MTDIPDDLPDRAAGVYAALADADEPLTKHDLADAVDLAPSTIQDYIVDIRGAVKGLCMTDDYGYYLAESGAEPKSDGADLGLDRVEQGDDPDPSDLTDRERYIATELQTGADVADLADDIGERESVVTQHLRDLKRAGWQVYHDDSTGNVVIEGDHTLRSSEHKGTRTRKANRWWETRHNKLVREYKGLDAPTPQYSRARSGTEDWITHLTDVHAGDRVRGYDGEVVHETADLPPIIDYITEQSLTLADKHNSEYDTAYLLYGGDMVTNEAIYEGQFEDLDAWLDEQIDMMHPPLLRQIKAFSRRFPSVRIICQPGNHGEIRASGSSKQANADLILYKSLRNTVAALQEEGVCENVGFTVGRAGQPTVFRLRDGELHGQLRHGQDRSPQADTSARKKEWLSTLLDSENYGDKVSVAWMGHHHVSGRLPWNGPPVIVTGTPKPGGEYPRKLGELVGPNQPEIATAHGVSDDGITGVFPIDARNYDGGDT